MPRCAVAVLMFVIGLARAETILSVSGTVRDSPSANGHSVGWSGTTAQTDVQISALLSDPDAAPAEGTAYLTSAIGPGVTAADEIAVTTFDLPGSFSGWYNLFSGLSLQPGTYWLTLTTADGSAPVDWARAEFPATIQFGEPGTYYGDARTIAPRPYAPGSLFFITPGYAGLEFDLSTNPTIVTANPEPSPAQMILSSCAGILLLRLIRRRSRFAGRRVPARPVGNSQPCAKGLPAG